MEFPSKPWLVELGSHAPSWPTHQVDFIDDFSDSHSVWISNSHYQYFKTTSDVDDMVMERPQSSGDWDVAEWAKRTKNYSYVKITDLQPIEENE